MTFSVDEIVQQAKRTRASRTAGKVRRAAFVGPGVIEVCNRVKITDGIEHRCCRPKGHSNECCYVVSSKPLAAHQPPRKS